MLQKIVKKTKKRIKPISIILLVILAAAVYWYWQTNVFAKDVLKLEILGPGQADFAKDFDYTVKYKNNGTTRLEEAKLIFEYPEHSIAEGKKPLWQEIALGDINPGEEKTIDGIADVEEFLRSPEKKIRFLDVTFCEGGCIGGPCLSKKLTINQKKQKVLDYMKLAEKESIPENRKGLIEKAGGIKFTK